MFMLIEGFTMQENNDQVLICQFFYRFLGRNYFDFMTVGNLECPTDPECYFILPWSCIYIECIKGLWNLQK